MRLHRIVPVVVVILAAACERADGGAKAGSAPAADSTTEPHAVPAAPVVLVDTTLPSVSAGDRGWDYHRRAEADLDGDGQPERASLIARVSTVEEEGFQWDDGQPWALYIEEADGTRTDVYRRFVQLGTVDAHVSTAAAGGGVVNLLVVEHTPQQMVIYEVTYAGPGRVSTAERFRRELHPERGFEHFSGERRAQRSAP